MVTAVKRKSAVNEVDKKEADPFENLSPGGIKKYERISSSVDVDSLTDKKLKSNLNKTEKTFKHAVARAVRSEILLTEDAGFLEAEGLEKTFKFKQNEIKRHVELNAARKIFDLQLEEFGPYRANYTRNGRYLLLGGSKGHVAAFDWKTGKLAAELHLNEQTNDVHWMHNETMFAVAQRKYVYLYDRSGLELHQLKHHTDVSRLEFLPYHFLLVSVGRAGYLKYQDISTGQLVNELRTKQGACGTMVQNPYNAVIHLGHGNGTVSMWSPTMSTPLVKILCHRGLVTSVACDSSGKYMATSGLDGQLKLWDLRTYQCLQQYFTPTPASSIHLSQRGLLGVAFGPHVQIWKDAFLEKQKSPYMSHIIEGESIADIQFCPFDDVLGIGHTGGFSSILIPGAGEPNIDSFEANPYQTRKQRQESEVKGLLEKLQPEMITLDPNSIGQVRNVDVERLTATKKTQFEANHPEKSYKAKNKARGKNSALKRYLRKKSNVIDQKKMDILRKLEKDAKSNSADSSTDTSIGKKSALDRFILKKN